MKRGYACLRRADGRIRLFCRRLTRRQRSLVAITAFLLFLAACLYTIVSALSGPGKSDGTMRIEHIRRLDLRPEDNTHPPNNCYDENGYTEDKETAGTVG